MSNQCQIDVEAMLIPPLKKGGEADWRVRSGGSVPNKPHTAIVSLNCSYLFSWGPSHNYRAICCKMGYRTNAPV